MEIKGGNFNQTYGNHTNVTVHINREFYIISSKYIEQRPTCCINSTTRRTSFPATAPFNAGVSTFRAVGFTHSFVYASFIRFLPYHYKCRDPASLSRSCGHMSKSCIQPNFLLRLRMNRTIRLPNHSEVTGRVLAANHIRVEDGKAYKQLQLVIYVDSHWKVLCFWNGRPYARRS